VEKTKPIKASIRIEKKLKKVKTFLIEKKKTFLL
jgi:hypothetical protein